MSHSERLADLRFLEVDLLVRLNYLAPEEHSATVRLPMMVRAYRGMHS